jgi:hypothetical protein
MALSGCAFVVSPAPATSFISLPLCRTSRQWRCVSSARQQGEPVRRSRKRLHVGRGACRSGSDVQPGTSRNAPDSKTNYATAFFDSIGQERDIGRGTAETRPDRPQTPSPNCAAASDAPEAPGTKSGCCGGAGGGHKHVHHHHHAARRVSPVPDTGGPRLNASSVLQNTSPESIRSVSLRGCRSQRAGFATTIQSGGNLDVFLW